MNEYDTALTRRLVAEEVDHLLSPLRDQMNKQTDLLARLCNKHSGEAASSPNCGSPPAPDMMSPREISGLLGIDFDNTDASTMWDIVCEWRRQHNKAKERTRVYAVTIAGENQATAEKGAAAKEVWPDRELRKECVAGPEFDSDSKGGFHVRYRNKRIGRVQRSCSGEWEIPPAVRKWLKGESLSRIPAWFSRDEAISCIRRDWIHRPVSTNGTPVPDPKVGDLLAEAVQNGQLKEDPQGCIKIEDLADFLYREVSRRHDARNIEFHLRKECRIRTLVQAYDPDLVCVCGYRFP